MSEITKALATVSTSDRELTATLDYARKLSASELLPEQYRGKPQNVLFAVEYGRSIGVDPIVAMNQIHVIKGKPTASAQLMGALVRKAGHKLRINWDGKTARAELIRADDETFTFVAEWTIERAREAKLTGNDTYAKFLPNMLKARAISEVVRDGAPEVLAGASYTPAELGAPVADELPAHDPDTGEVLEGELVDDDQAPATPEPEVES